MRYVYPFDHKHKKPPMSMKDLLGGKGANLAEMTSVLGLLQPQFMTDYDETQAIGRRYRRQDEIGTPFCITVDFETLEDEAVTIRERDSMTQERVPLTGVTSWLAGRLPGC